MYVWFSCIFLTSMHSQQVLDSTAYIRTAEQDDSAHTPQPNREKLGADQDRYWYLLTYYLCTVLTYTWFSVRTCAIHSVSFCRLGSTSAFHHKMRSIHEKNFILCLITLCNRYCGSMQGLMKCPKDACFINQLCVINMQLEDILYWFGEPPCSHAVLGQISILTYKAHTKSDNC